MTTPWRTFADNLQRSVDLERSADCIERDIEELIVTHQADAIPHMRKIIHRAQELMGETIEALEEEQAQKRLPIPHRWRA